MVFNGKFLNYLIFLFVLHCFDAFGWVTRREFSLEKSPVAVPRGSSMSFKEKLKVFLSLCVCVCECVCVCLSVTAELLF